MTEVPATHPQGTPCWVSLLVRNLPLTQAFYGELFGWEFEPGPTHFGPYVRAVLDGRLVAGIGESPRLLHQPVAWTTYLSTDDADSCAERIRAYGGTVAVGPLDAEDEAGRMAIAADPAGASFGVWQPSGLTGIGVVGEPGTLSWSELVTRDASVASFYQAVFGFEADAAVPSGDGSGSPSEQVTLRLEGRPIAGVQGVGTALPRERGPHWMTHFEVTDTDASVRRVTQLGGRVVRGPHEVKNGRVAEVADPQGATFMVIRTNS